MQALEILREKFLGNFFSRFSVGDTFDFYFGQFWLIAQNVESKNEEGLSQEILQHYHPANIAVDKEDIAKSAIIFSTRGKEVVGVSLAPDSALQLNFENGVKLLFPTDTDIVDWHWAIKEKPIIHMLTVLLGVLALVRSSSVTADKRMQKGLLERYALS